MWLCLSFEVKQSTLSYEKVNFNNIDNQNPRRTRNKQRAKKNKFPQHPSAVSFHSKPNRQQCPCCRLSNCFSQKIQSVERIGLHCFWQRWGTMFQSVRSTDRICFQDARGLTLLHRQKRHSLRSLKAGIDFYETSEMHIISTLAWQKLNRELPRLNVNNSVALLAFAVRFGKTKNQTTKQIVALRSQWISLRWS